MEEDLVKTMRALFKISKTPQEIEKFLKLNKRNERLILQRLHNNSELTVGEKSRLENILSLLKSLSQQIKTRKFSGQGLENSTSATTSSSTSTSVVWKTVSIPLYFICMFISILIFLLFNSICLNLIKL